MNHIRTIKAKSKTITYNVFGKCKRARLSLLDKYVSGAYLMAEYARAKLGEFYASTRGFFESVYKNSDAESVESLRKTYAEILKRFGGRINFVFDKTFVDGNGNEIPEVPASAVVDGRGLVVLYDSFFGKIDGDEKHLNDRCTVILHELAHLEGLANDGETDDFDSAEALRNFTLLVCEIVAPEDLFNAEEKANSDSHPEAESKAESALETNADADADANDNAQSVPTEQAESSDDAELEDEGESDKEQNSQTGENGELSYNPNHYPAGAEGGKGGQFAPKDGGSSGGGSQHSDGGNPRVGENTPSNKSSKTSDTLGEKSQNIKKRLPIPDLYKRKPWLANRKRLTIDETKKVIETALDFMAEKTKKPGYNSPEARELMLGTAIKETDLKPRWQDPRSDGRMGDGNGLFQMEKKTFDDLFHNYLPQRQPVLYKAIREKFKPADGKLNHDYLLEDDVFAAVMARVNYAVSTVPLPKLGDTEAQARYWFKYYNKGKVSKEIKVYIDKWKAANKK